MTIKELAIKIKNVVDYKGDVIFNELYPDRMYRKLLNMAMLNKLGWTAKRNLDEDIIETYHWYKINADII